MNRTENEPESFEGGFAAADGRQQFFEVPYTYNPLNQL